MIRKPIARLFAASLLIAATLFATGCATTGSNPALTSKVSSAKTQGDEAIFYSVKAVQAENNLVISGSIKTATPFTTPPTGHVDVAVLDSQGAVLAKASHLARYRVLVTKASQLSSQRPPRFRFSFPLTPETGTQVKLALHKETPFSWSTVFDCGDNRALAQITRNN
jgi:hypothetical protein